MPVFGPRAASKFKALIAGSVLRSAVMICACTLAISLHAPAIADAAQTAPTDTSDKEITDIVDKLIATNEAAPFPKAVEEFGAKALTLSGISKYVRLQYAAEVYLQRADTAGFTRWNEALLKVARAEGSARYIAVAEYDRDIVKWLHGDQAADGRLKAREAVNSDWYLKAHDLLWRAEVFVAQGKMVDAMTYAAKAEALVPNRDIEGMMTLATVDDVRAFELLYHSEVVNAARMLKRETDTYLSLGFPLADSQDVFDMSWIEIGVGDEKVAREIEERYLAMAQREGDLTSVIYAARLCARVENVFGTPQSALKCFDNPQLPKDLVAAGLPSMELLFVRGISNAELGHMDLARRDLEVLQRMKAKGDFPPNAFKRMPVLEAAVLADNGKVAEAAAKIDKLVNASSIDSAQRVRAAVREVTDEFGRNLELREQVERGQTFVIGLAALLVLGAGIMIFLQRRLVVKLRSAQAKAEAASVAKAEFLSNMSHEIRTPLTTVIGYADLLSARGELSDEVRGQIRRIRDGGEALLWVVNEILDFSKLEAGQVELDPHPFDPMEVTARAVGLAEVSAKAKGLDLHLSVDGVLPRAVLGDSSRLVQVLLNLLNNAVKFTAEGEVRVTVRYLSEAGRLAIAVKDSGCGIAPDKIDRLFERFTQADGAVNRRFGGTGLGLAIVKSLVERMGGEVRVVSQLGQGAEFSFEVAAPASEDAPEATTAPASVPPTHIDSGDLQILLVDDRQENRDLFRTLLKALGFECTEARGGAHAVELATVRRFDLILMDVQMPEVDGLQATGLIRRGGGPNANIPIIAITADASQDDIHRCLAAGMSDHVAKPVTIIALAEALTKWAYSDADAEPAERGFAG